VFDEARHLRNATDLQIDTTAVSAGRLDGDVAGLLRNLGDNAAVTPAPASGSRSPSTMAAWS
jgi:hypothetical protein